MMSNTLVVDTTTPNTSYIAALSGGGQFRWNVAACNDAGCSAFTTPLYFQTGGTPPGPVPATPTDPAPGTTTGPGPTIDDPNVMLSWTASSGATYYSVGVRDMVSDTLVVDTTTPDTSYLASLSSAGQYRWSVAACNDAGCSPFTTSLYFKTGGTPPPPGEPVLSVSPALPVDFGPREINKEWSTPLTVKNIGEGRLVGTCRATSAFTVPDCSFDLGANDIVTFNLTFKPTLTIPYFGEVTFTTNATNQFRLLVNGTGIPVEPTVDSDGDGLSDIWEDRLSAHCRRNANDPYDALNDCDGDALPDVWEITGNIQVEYFGSVGHVDLPAMGANPLHKDIFVEVDFMGPSRNSLCETDNGWVPCITVEGASYQPAADAVQLVMNAFANAPVSNPDGVDGIAIHIDAGSDAPMRADGVPGTWGELSNSNSIGAPRTLYVWLDIPFWNDFERIKRRNLDSARRRVFHYALFVPAFDRGEFTGIARSGLSGSGSDFVVALANGGTDNHQAGTLMHELGHNLGLHHGGPMGVLGVLTSLGQAGVRYKPNYLSVMNYAFQLDGIPTAEPPAVGVGPMRSIGIYDYSRFALPLLDERQLANGIASTEIPVPLSVAQSAALRQETRYGTKFYCPGTSQATTSAPPGWSQSATLIDWSCGSTEAASDVNGDGDVGELESLEDWPELVYGGGAIGATGVRLPEMEVGPEQDELPVAAVGTAPFRVDVVSPGAIVLGRGRDAYASGERQEYWDGA